MVINFIKCLELEFLNKYQSDKSKIPELNLFNFLLKYPLIINDVSKNFAYIVVQSVIIITFTHIFVYFF